MSIIITNYNALLDLEAYLRRRYRVTTRSRSTDVGSRMESLQGFVKTSSGRDCIVDIENLMRLMPRVAILSNPWLQTAEEVLIATMELYDDLIQQMPYLRCMESSVEFRNYYRKQSKQGRVMNSYFFSRRYMVYLDLPVSNIATELSNPKLSGASMFFSSDMYEAVSEDTTFKTKLSLAENFSNADVDFEYDQMFDNGRITKYGKNHRQLNK